MELKSQLRRQMFVKIAIFLVSFGCFTPKVQAQILPPPTITAQPLSTNVQNGDTVSFTVKATCSLSLISTVVWYQDGNPLSLTNAGVSVSVGGLLSTTISSTLTLKSASSQNAGNYTVLIVNLLGGSVTSSKATLGILPAPPVVNALVSGSGMVSSGFKLQFSAPTGSNLVVEASTDMRSWTPISTNVVAGGSVSVTDIDAKNHDHRYYRARLQ
jgi:hypothetical protein